MFIDCYNAQEIPIPQYSEQEYANNLEKEGWTKEETDHLFDLARRFALRFTVIQVCEFYKSMPQLGLVYQLFLIH